MREHDELEASPAELASRFGASAARARLLQWLIGPGLKSPRRLLDVVRQAEDLLAGADDSTRETVWNVEVAALARMGPAVREDAADLSVTAAELRAGLVLHRYSADQVAAGFVGLAYTASMTDRERQGLDFLEEAVEHGGRLLEPHRQGLRWLRAVLHAGNAVNAVNASAYDEAFDSYTRAIAVEVILDLQERALHHLRGLLDIVKRSPYPLTDRVIKSLGRHVLLIETSPGALGAQGEEILQDIFRATVGLHVAHGIGSLEELVVLLQCFKARRFDMLVRAGVVRLPHADERGCKLLEKIAITERELPLEDRMLAPSNPDEALDEDILLAGYVRAGEGRTPGQSAVERLYNLEHTFESHFQQRFLETVRHEILNPLPPLSVAVLQACLDERTVLVQQAHARTPNGLWGTVTLLLTRETVLSGGVSTGLPDGWTMLEKDGRSARMHNSGMLVSSLRRELRESWTPREPITDEVRNSLDSHIYFGHMADALKRLHQDGKDHLCIVPHGPLHFLPYHLIELEQRPLADDWIVTYLPSVGMLLRAADGPAGKWGALKHNRDEVAVFGVGYGSDYPFDLPELPESADEARAVASTYHVEPKLDRDATSASVRHAFEHARIVHLSTHGRHNVVAPGFQTIYLWPEDGSDGRLRPYEIATLDLAGLEIVTLSACETVLGRFDFSDNLRGLSATLLLGGVKTIVGTLWNVEPAVSHAFFKEFHSYVAEGRQLLDAFVAAQVAARTVDQHYLEWGAFYLTGGW